jgi:hypothetical protein
MFDLSPDEMRVSDWFEDIGVMYNLEIVKVATRKVNISKNNNINEDNADNKSPVFDWIDANVYVWIEDRKINTGCKLDYSIEWSYDMFRKENLEWYLQNTVEPCRQELDRLGIGKVVPEQGTHHNLLH